MDAPTLAGTLLQPGDAGYDDARRVFNGMIDRRPALIARCASTEDVAAAVKHARANHLTIAVHGGGHGVTGAAVCDDGLMVDLRGMKAIEVDADAQIVRCQAGLTWGEFDAATAAHGLAVTGGRVPSTGVAGLALGSGSGWIERKYGFTCDSLIAAEVVTADGDVITASEDENAELFWGLRGGGNFGIVTRFEFRAHPIPPLIYGGMLMYPQPMAADVVKHYRDFMAGAPDEVGGAPAFISAPPAEFVPEPVRGKPVLGVVISWAGDADEGRELLKPLVEYGPPAVAMVDAMPYTALQGLLEPSAPSGMRNYWTADFLTELPDEAIELLAEHHARVPSPLTQVILVPGGGAIKRVPDSAMAFGNRDAPWNIHYLGMWPPDPAADDANIAWIREVSGAMKPYASGGVYLNFLGDEGQERVKAAFGPEKYARLVALKDEWDPDNAFCMNQNIRPSGANVARGTA